MTTNKVWGKVMFCNMCVILVTWGMCLSKLKAVGWHLPIPEVEAPSFILTSPGSHPPYRRNSCSFICSFLKNHMAFEMGSFSWWHFVYQLGNLDLKNSQDILSLYSLECVLFMSRLYFGIVWTTIKFTTRLSWSVIESVDQVHNNWETWYCFMNVMG